jgi:hypothetical protein
MRECTVYHEREGNNDADEMAHYLLTLAQAQRGLGAIGRAETSLHAAEQLCIRRDLQELLARVRQELAELYAARGQHTEAITGNEAVPAAQQIPRRSQRNPNA